MDYSSHLEARQLLRLCSEGKEAAAIQHLLALPRDEKRQVANSSASGWPILLTALRHRCIAFASALINSGAEVMAKAPTGNTPLHYAAFHGEVHLLRRLVATDGVDVNMASNNVITGTPSWW